MSSILIVEDEERIASFVDKGLRANGFATAIAADGEAGSGDWPRAAGSTWWCSTSGSRTSTGSRC